MDECVHCGPVADPGCFEECGCACHDPAGALPPSPSEPG